MRVGDMRAHRADGDLGTALLDHPFGPGEERIEHGDDVLGIVGIEDQRLALLDQRFGKRLQKLAPGQLDGLDLACRRMTGLVLGLERDIDSEAGPRMFGQIIGGRIGDFGGAAETFDHTRFHAHGFFLERGG